jgi:hypothetical protein
METPVSGEEGKTSTRANQNAATIAVGLWVIVAGALVYGIWETVQKVSALFG